MNELPSQDPKFSILRSALLFLALDLWQSQVTVVTSLYVLAVHVACEVRDALPVTTTPLRYTRKRWTLNTCAQNVFHCSI